MTGTTRSSGGLDERRKRLLFRFYDPRVLLPFAETCDAAQLREIFGPVQRYLIEQTAGREIVAVRMEDGTATSERHMLSRGA